MGVSQLLELLIRCSSVYMTTGAFGASCCYTRVVFGPSSRGSIIQQADNFVEYQATTEKVIAILEANAATFFVR